MKIRFRERKSVARVKYFDYTDVAKPLFYYVGNIACDISGITRKSTAENPIGAADFLIFHFPSPIFLKKFFFFRKQKTNR